MVDEAALAALKAEIEAQCALFSENFRNGEIEKLVEDYYTAEPLMSAPDAPLLRGRDNIAGALGALKVSGVSDIVLKPVEVRLDEDGDTAYEFGSATVKADTPDGPVEQAMRYLVVWRPTDAGWRVDADLFAPGPV